MPVRKTETKIPDIAGFTIDDLGQHAASTTSAQVHLISYISSPLGLNMPQNYVVMVTDNNLQSNVASYEWIFNNNGTNTTNPTTVGLNAYTPTALGSLSVTVNLKNSAGATLHTVVLSQQVVALNLELEQLIDQEEGTRSPSAGNPPITREVINSLRIYADTAVSPTSGAEQNRLMLSLIYANLSASNAEKRNTLLQNCAAAIETKRDTFFSTAKEGIGVTKLRPHLACMYLLKAPNTPFVAVTELPADAKPAQVRTTEETIRTAFNALSADEMLDVFNLLRFPKSNIKVCKLVLDGLKKYFTESFAALLTNRTMGRRLITQYEKGPIALPTSGAPELSNTSDKIYSLTIMPAWRVNVSILPGSTGVANPQTRIFGVPEPIPEKTFIASPNLEGDPEFIRSGERYHQLFNISFTTVRSFEEIIDNLESNTTIVNHLRIFSHANEEMLGLPLFTGGAGFTASEHLDGFLKDELSVALGIMKVHFFSTDGFIHKLDTADRFHARLKTNGSAAIVPFGLHVAGSSLIPELRELFRRYMDIWAVKMPGLIPIEKTVQESPHVVATRNLTSGETNEIIALVELIIRLQIPLVKAKIAGLTDAHFTALKSAILALAPADVGVLPGKLPNTHDPFVEDDWPNDNFQDFMRDCKSAVRALAPGNTFFAKLQRVRNNTFNATSTIDIRGCMAGKHPTGASTTAPFLISVQKFFGKTGALPTVTAPEWFQSFNANMAVQRLADTAAIDTIFADGFEIEDPNPADENDLSIDLLSIDIVKCFDEWSRLSNINDHFDFFKTQFAPAATLIDFASLRWRSWRLTGSAVGIPPLNLYSSRVDDLVTLQPAECINRLRENFGAAGSNLPSAVVTLFNALQPRIATFKTIEDQFTALPGGPFSSFYTSLKTLAGQFTTANNLPAPSSALIDATEPNPLNRAHISGYITKFRTYFNGLLNPEINAVFTEIKNAIALPDAKRHYYFRVRLPFRADTSKNDKIKYVVFCIEGAVSDAMKSYMKCQWKGTPSQVTDMYNTIDGLTITNANANNFLRTAAITESASWIRDEKFAIAPLPLYDTHIKRTTTH